MTGLYAFSFFSLGVAWAKEAEKHRFPCKPLPEKAVHA
ncbi:protein of unknown function [Methylocaldum szegediense]|uniref:Uncharacterized protein n=1 Tax=Methylocaldum szegediense TaxID=73780 RepID=A0ABM9I6E4_9GAMM|nr:protein of unknown function [Methylocaldum szegediense]